MSFGGVGFGRLVSFEAWDKEKLVALMKALDIGNSVKPLEIFLFQGQQIHGNQSSKRHLKAK